MILSKINSPADLKKLSREQLPVLAKEIRREIIEVVGHNGGHLSSNLGVVELTIALHRVFDSPSDAFVWDVSHQCYAHKLLTGRYKQFKTLRQKDGISGFTRCSESEHDFFDCGHASTSISSALGLLTGWHLTHKDGKVIAIIGDGALTGGMAFEALNHAGQISKDLIVILNDNQMSISKNTGAISRYLSRLTMTSHYQKIRFKIDSAVTRIPYLNRHLEKFIFRLKRGLKGLLFLNNLFVDFGFEYVGPLDGHNIDELEMVLRRVKKFTRPVVIHVITKKGRGYNPAENDPTQFHGIGPFCITDGTIEKFDTMSYTEAFINALMKVSQSNEKIVAVTAAMSKGTGLGTFQRKYPSRFFDTGIAEEHAATFSGGLAAGGLIPVLAIYSTFLMRAVDQIIQDIALQNRHVIICIDRAGAVPDDGETHQGIFDIALLRPIPHMILLSPATAVDLSMCLEWAVSADGPVAIRYPKNSCPSEALPFMNAVHPGRGILLTSDVFSPALAARLEDVSEKEKHTYARVLLVCTGSMYSEVLTAARNLLMKGFFPDIYTLRFIKPFDESYFVSLASKYTAIVFIEDSVKTGGIGEYLRLLLITSVSSGKYACKIPDMAVLAFPDNFPSNGNRAQILEAAGLLPDDIALSVEKIIKLQEDSVIEKIEI